jgi:trafficking protein particle complex subunit 6
MLAKSYHAGLAATAGPAPNSPAPTHLEISVEYLLLEVIRYYSTDQDHVSAVHAVETMGFRMGSQLAERLTAGEDRMDEPLIKMRFICKQFWTALFGRQVGGLKTNHKVQHRCNDKGQRPSCSPCTGVHVQNPM